jgi:putative PIG3 family NAD(P)H quinone oxidoreductase
MRAAWICRPGGPEVLEIRELEDPFFGPDEVLVRVHASALNRADLLQRRGHHPPPPGAPAIPGLEFAGQVERLGARVLGLRPGDRVMGIVGGGGHATRVAVHERLCIRVPERLGWEEAAAIPEAFLTAHDALFARAFLAPGEVVLVHAAASGVGTATLQLATLAGARVLALSRTPEKRARLAGMGAVAVLDPGEEHVAERIREASGGAGIDVVVELVGAATWPLDLEVLAERGRIVLVGTLGGSTVTADLGALMRKRVTVTGTMLRPRPLEEKIALTRAFARTALPAFADGRLRPVVDRVLPLDEIAEAHRLLEANRSFGKIVLKID